MSRYADQLPINTAPNGANFLLATNDSDGKALERIPLELVGGGGSTEYTILDQTALDVDSNVTLTAGLYLYVGNAPTNFDLSGLADGERVEIINHTAHKVFLFGFNNWVWNGTTTALQTDKGLIVEKGGLIVAKHSGNLLLFNTLPNGLSQDYREGLAPIILTYTITQSSVYGGNIGTYENLRNGLGTDGAATQGGIQWIKASFAQSTLINNITVGGGVLPNWGGVSSYLNNISIQYSNNDISWTNLINISGVADSGTNQFKTFQTGGVMAQYWRLYYDGYIATTEFNLT